MKTIIISDIMYSARMKSFHKINIHNLKHLSFELSVIII